jgi:sec-independent protein translocase protein TatA
MINAMIGMPQGAEWLIILAIVILVFGAAKLPDLARGTGQALRIFKAETKSLKDDDEKDETPPPPPAAIPPTTDELPTTHPTDAPTTEQDRHTDTHNG